MNVETTSVDALLTRLEAVEKQNRGMRYAGIASLVVVGAVLLSGYAKPSGLGTVEATAFVLRDESGQLRASLGIDGESVGLNVFDKAGVSRQVLGQSKDGGGLIFRDGNGEQRMALEAADSRASLLLSDQSGDARAFVGFGEKLTVLSLGDGVDAPRAALSNRGAGTPFALILFDENGNRTYTIP